MTTDNGSPAAFRAKWDAARERLREALDPKTDAQADIVVWLQRWGHDVLNPISDMVEGVRLQAVVRGVLGLASGDPLETGRKFCDAFGHRGRVVELRELEGPIMDGPVYALRLHCDRCTFTAWQTFDESGHPSWVPRDVGPAWHETDH